MLIITGTPRSGTTLLAAFCKMMGHDPGGEYKPEVNAGLEEFGARLAQECFEKGQVQESERIISRYSRPLFKLPHILSRGTPEILELWASHKPGLKLIVLKREPALVARSLAKNPKTFGEKGDEEEIRIKYESLIPKFWTEVCRLGIPHQTLNFPDFLNDFPLVQDTLTNFGGLTLQPNAHAISEFGVPIAEGDNPQSVWARWIDERKVHHR